GGSFDPDGDVLAYAWSSNNHVLGTAVSLAVDPALGVSTYTLNVSDPRGLSSADDVAVTVRDTTAPSAPASLSTSVEADASCTGAVPDLTTAIHPTDICSSVSVTQDVLAGTTLVLNHPIAVHLTSSDTSNNRT